MPCSQGREVEKRGNKHESAIQRGTPLGLQDEAKKQGTKGKRQGKLASPPEELLSALSCAKRSRNMSPACKNTSVTPFLLPNALV